MKKSEYKAIIEIVRESIFRIDLYSLISSGAPEDEFDSEIISIVGQLNKCKSGRDISHAIARTFSSSFGDKFDPKDFEEEGLKIYQSLLKLE